MFAEEITKLFDKFAEILNAGTTRMEPWAQEIPMMTSFGDQFLKEDQKVCS